MKATFHKLNEGGELFMIDLRSDTVTKPTKEMRKAMVDAAVGDDVYREDPTVNALEKRAAEILGKEAALLVTSGTQGNQIAVLAHMQPGEEIVLEQDAHLFYYEAGAVAALAGVQTRTVKGSREQMPLVGLEAAIRGNDIHLPKTGLISIENTHNRGGGAVLPVNYMDNVHQLAQKYDIPIHLDGARVFNAAVSLGVDVQELTKHVDTVQTCLSKGLSAPVGSILAGSKAFIENARKIRKRLGGGMRQAGVIAAPGLIALNQMIERLQDDHQHAKALATGLAKTDGVDISMENIETNMVFIGTTQLQIDATAFVTKLQEHGILANAEGPDAVRFVTHREITKQDIEVVIQQVREIVDAL